MRRLKKEKKNISSEMARLDSSRQQMVSQSAKVNEKLGNVDHEISLLKNKDLAMILAERSTLETEEAKISQEEAKISQEETELLGEKTAMPESGLAGLQEDDLLATLEEEISERSRSIEQLKSEIAAEQQELARKKAEIESKRAEGASTLGITTIVVVIIGLLLVVVFYIVGRRKRSNNS